MADAPSGLKYRRVVLKLSGEALGAGGGALGVDMGRVQRTVREIQSVKEAGGEVAVVVGGGNWIRGRVLRGQGIDDVTADTMGMLATIINGMALRSGLDLAGLEPRLMTAIAMPAVAEPYCQPQCMRHLRRGRVVVLAAGTGNPHFTTDSGAALRARELGADAVLKATTVDGVYCSDPRANPAAERYHALTYADFIAGNLGVMDIAAVNLCREGRIPIVVFNFGQDGNVLCAARGDDIGTVIH